MTPTELYSDDSLRQIPIEKRKCRFADETEGVVQLFSYYTQPACEFECYLRKAADVCRYVEE